MYGRVDIETALDTNGIEYHYQHSTGRYRVLHNGRTVNLSIDTGKWKILRCALWGIEEQSGVGLHDLFVAMDVAATIAGHHMLEVAKNELILNLVGVVDVLVSPSSTKLELQQARMQYRTVLRPQWITK